MEQESNNPYKEYITELKVGEKSYRYFDFNKLNDPRIAQLPISIRVLLECAIRNCDGFNVTQKDVESILNWKQTSTTSVPISSFRPKSHSNPPESSFKISQECP